MRKFKDNLGEEWSIEINAWTAIQIKQDCGINIREIREGKDLQLISEDPATIGAVLWLLVADQAAEKNVEEKAFFLRLLGDHFDEALKSLLAEIIDFFPPQQRALLKSAFGKIVGMQNAGLEAAQKTLETMSEDDFRKLAETAMTGFASSSRSPVTSESSPGASPSGS